VRQVGHLIRLYWDARSAEHYTEMHGQQNIILRCTVSRTLYWDARSAKHYTEMYGQQNIILRCTDSRTLYWDARSAKHYTEIYGHKDIKKLNNWFRNREALCSLWGRNRTNAYYIKNLRLQIVNSAIRTAEMATIEEDSRRERRGEAAILIDREVLEGTNLH
jgi:hypothetical protein